MSNNTTFAALKKNRSTQLSSLHTEIEKINNPSTNRNDDDRLWRAELDNSGNGYAVIRFLPAPEGEDLPWVRVFTHGFQGPGGWYIENSLTTLGQKDPLSDYNSMLWNSGVEANKEIARKQKRRLTYISNILVVKDPANPQNEGQVRLFKFGKKIFDKVNGSMNPEFEDETPVNPFDLWEGTNFKLKIRKVDGFSNYDKSEFEAPAALLDGDDAKLEELWKKEYKLLEFVDPKNFKSYDDLKTRLDTVLGTTRNVPTSVEADDLPFESNTPTITPEMIPRDGGGDESLEYFRKLAEG